MVVCAEGIFYGLNHYGKKDMMRETSWIRMHPTNKEGGFGEHPHPTGPRQCNSRSSTGATNCRKMPRLLTKWNYGGNSYTMERIPLMHTVVASRPSTILSSGAVFSSSLGCSVTFGLWVNDDETMPYVAQYASHYRPYNYGVSGYGPHHMLAQLQSRELKKRSMKTMAERSIRSSIIISIEP